MGIKPLRIEERLGPLIEGDVHDDLINRSLFATDASIYQIIPKCVVYPKSVNDVAQTLAFARENNLSIVPRGSGSSLAGQAVGDCLVIDFSKYLNEIHEINAINKYALVSPGVVLDQLNMATSEFGLKFGPDPASSDRATFGGMIGNNSSGSHSIQYGMTVDHIQQLQIILSDGQNITTKGLDFNPQKSDNNNVDIESKLYKYVIDLQRQFPDGLGDRWPNVWRKASGYNLDYFFPSSGNRPPLWDLYSSNKNYPPTTEGVINLSPLFVGSEGTLGIVTQAKINLVSLPKETILVILQFDDIASACDRVPDLLNMQPSAIELIPKELIERARSVPAYAKLTDFVVGNPEAILLMEFEGENLEQLKKLGKSISGHTFIATDKEQQANIWKVRKVGLGLLMSIKGDAKPLPFVEDVAVPVEKLGLFVREFEKILAEYATLANIYAHASAGCLHIRPIINLKSIKGIEQLRGISKAVVNLTLSLGGAISGEHGDGRARSEWLNKMFGEEIYNKFVELKTIADPNNYLNPQIKIDAQKIEENLRYGPQYDLNVWDATLSFQSAGGINQAIELCNGAGVCRKNVGVMCPTFQATGNEYLSTRGRANITRLALSDVAFSDIKSSKVIFEALDTCIECKGCKSECPSGVDMAKIKYDFLYDYYKTHRRPIRDYLFSNIEVIGKIANRYPKIYNYMSQSSLAKSMQELFFGISKMRNLPLVSTSQSPFKNRNLPSGNYVEEIIFLFDPYYKFFNSKLIDDALFIFEKLGCKVHVPATIGAGRIYLSKGFLGKAKNNAHQLLSEIQKIDPSGNMPIVGLEPSEIYTLKDEYSSLFPNNDEVEKVAGRCWMIEEFLLRSNKGKTIPRIESLRSNNNCVEVLFHGHCYQKTQPPAADSLSIGEQATIDTLEYFGHTIEKIDSGCCGMAGSFGYQKEHYQLSMEIGNLNLFPAINNKKKQQIVVATGASCKTQIQSGTKVDTLHPVEIIAKSIQNI